MFVYVCSLYFSTLAYVLTYTIGVVLVWFSVGGMARASWARLLGTMYILALKGYLLKGYLSGHWSFSRNLGTKTRRLRPLPASPRQTTPEKKLAIIYREKNEERGA